MLFNSLDFAVFLPIVFFLDWYVFKKNIRIQNLLIVIASYVFYGWWDWRFLSLIIFSTLIDYTVGIKLGKEEKALNQAEVSERDVSHPLKIFLALRP